MTEHEIQTACVQWFDYMHPSISQLLFAVPNGGFRGKATAAKLKAEGVRAGVADLFLSVPAKGYHGFYLEAKRPTTYQRPDQKRFQLAVEAQGYKYAVFRSKAQFIELVTKYLAIE